MRQTTLASLIAQNWLNFLKRLPFLFFGLFLLAVGLVANLQSNLGMNPWGVLHVGIAIISPLTFGQSVQVVGFAVIILGWLMGFAPGFGTFANMYFVGFFVDLIIGWDLIPVQTEIPWQLGLLLFSIVVMGIGSLFYLKVQLGAGPRDGLMIGLTKKLNKPLQYVRGGIEITVSILGYIMGGPVGIGTLVTAFTIGYSVQLFFKLGGFDGKSEQMNLLQLYRFLKSNKNRDTSEAKIFAR